MFQRIKRSDGLDIETLRCPIRINNQIFKSEIAAPLVGQHNNEIFKSNIAAPRVGQHTDEIIKEYAL